MKSTILALIMTASAALPGAAGAATVGGSPDIYLPMCALPNGVLLLCALYNRLVDGGEVAIATAPKTYITMTNALTGTTPATITGNFPAFITKIFTDSPYINIQVGNMDPAMLALLSHSYYVHTKGQMAPLLTVAAQRLTAINLMAFAGVFSPTVFTPYVEAYTPASTKAQYLAYIAAKAPLMVPLSQWAYNHAGYTAYTSNGLSTGYPPSGMTAHSPAAAAFYAQQAAARAAFVQKNGIQPDAGYIPAPLPTMAVSDIWLEFYCAGAGTTAVEATIMTGMYAGPLLDGAGWVGYKIGTWIYNITESLSPGYFEDEIEFWGDLWQSEVLPTGTITVGDPIDIGGASGDWDDYSDYGDFDVCVLGITC